MRSNYGLDQPTGRTRKTRMPSARFQNLDPEKRELILGAAAEEFADHGYEGASLNRIISRTGLSKGVLYYYFDDKKDLYLTVMESVERHFIQQVSIPDKIGSVEDFWDTFRKQRIVPFLTIRENPVLYKLSREWAKMLSNHEVAPELMNTSRIHAGPLIEAFFRLGQQVGAVRTDLPMPMLIDLLLNVDGIGGQHLTDEFLDKPDLYADKIVDLFRRLFEPRRKIA